MKDKFDRQLAGMAWSLWKELGVSGVDRFHENCLVQVEELIILTSIISESDPRLRDEALDWCSRYHECISVSRLRTLVKELGSDANSSLLQFAATLNSVSSAKWLNVKPSKTKVKLSGKSILPKLDSPSLLMLRLRNLFGPGARADILTHFLTRNGMHYSAGDLIEIGYSKKNLFTILDHLASSGVLVATHVRNKKNYELRRAKELQVLIGKLPNIAPPWHKILQALISIRSIIPEMENCSELTKGVILRNCLARIEPLLPFFISPLLTNKPDFKNDLRGVMGILTSFQQGNFSMQYQVHDEFEIIVIQLLRALYQVDDCIDGIEEIQSKIENEAKHHEKVYKECYQLYLSFIGGLVVTLKQFLEFPFYKLMDETLADIPYQFSQEKLPQLLEKINEIKPIDQITSAQLAIREYRIFMSELDILIQFFNTFRKQLEDLYFTKTDIHLLSRADLLYKRHLVLVLFP